MLEEQVPHLDVPVHTRGEEDAGPGGTPRTVGKRALVVRGPHDRALLDVLAPNPRRPVAHAQEVLGVERIPSERTDRSVVAGKCYCNLVRGVFRFAIAAGNRRHKRRLNNVSNRR